MTNPHSGNTWDSDTPPSDGQTESARPDVLQSTPDSCVRAMAAGIVAMFERAEFLRKTGMEQRLLRKRRKFSVNSEGRKDAD